jgi:transglutaminase-like putative cysteine protease
MARAMRIVAVSVPALVVIAAAWLRLEHPTAQLWRVLALLGLALLPAAVARWGWRWSVAAAVVAIVGAGRLAAGVTLFPLRPLDPGSGFGLGDSLPTLSAQFGNGFSDFYGTHLPFDPRAHAAMGELVLVAIFCFCFLVVLLATARQAVAAALVLVAGAGWPATLLGPSHGLAMGAGILAAALFLLAGLGSRRVPAIALPAVAVVAIGAVAVGSATAARHGLVHWQSWNPAHVAGGPGGFGFVWDAQYGGLNWPSRPTVVLRVKSERRPSYLRATVLDDFRGDRWSVGPPRAADALEPAAALRPRNQTSESVTVQGLGDSHLVGGSVPIDFEAGVPLVKPERGFASYSGGLPPGFRYTVLSYSPRPTEAELRHAPAQYPPVLARDGLLDVGRGVNMPAFGTPRRAAAVADRLTHTPELYPYLRLARLAEQVTAGAGSPYAAVSDLEYWFVSSGGFRYSNHPLVIAPPLVGFVTQTRRGYCQFFAGAMTLMLRYLGIPARVAVGFAGGDTKAGRNVWLVTDRDAHAWVEVWFKGYGWLPFDPTPPALGTTRDPLSSLPVTSLGPSAPLPNPGVLSQAAANRPPTQPAASGGHGHALRRTPDRGVGGPSFSGAVTHGRGRGTVVLLVLLVGAAVAGAIAGAKFCLRFVRRQVRDPRRVPAACRSELAAFLVDQRIDVDGSATMHELGDLIRREFGVKPDAFVAAATAARYGPADRAGSAASDARHELRLLVEAMRRGLTRPERLRGLLSLRSLSRPSAAVARSASLGSGRVESLGS